MKSKQFLSRLLPRSLLSRMLWLLLLAIVLAQSLISGLWMRQLQKHELDGMLSATRNLANSAAATITFFQSLPLQYRQIALEQLRNMGGSRFFVSLNKEQIQLNKFPDSSRKNLVINEVRNVLHHKLGYGLTIQVDFADPDGLHVFNNKTLLADIPSSWARHTLLMEPLNPPILVTQIELAKGEWLYLAALLPAPYMTLEEASIPPHQIRFIVLLSGILFLFTFVLIRWQTRTATTISCNTSSKSTASNIAASYTCRMETNGWLSRSCSDGTRTKLIRAGCRHTSSSVPPRLFR